MTDYQDLLAIKDGEQRDAIRRCAHLLMLLVVDEDGPAYQREVTKLIDEEDQIFCAMISSAALQMAAHHLVESRSPEQRRELLLELMESNSTWNLDDLEPPAGAS